MKQKNYHPIGDIKLVSSRRIRRILQIVLIQILILVVIGTGMDWLLVRFDLLRPPFRYGDRDLGFLSSRLYRTSEQLGVKPGFAESSRITIAMVGDSHSALSLDSPLMSHEFVLEKILRKEGVPAIILSAGQGMYSPLQEYLLYKTRLRDRFSPRIVLLNFYTGNDFYDILRPDDRPHYARLVDGSIEMRKPVWFAYNSPDGGTWREQSRILWLADDLLERLGYPKVLTRIGQLSKTARTLNGNFVDVVRYLVDINRSVEPRIGYSGAFAAQMLNQSIFFHYFPEGRKRSLTFINHLLATARKENPDVIFVLSPIPSAALAEAIPADVRPYWNERLDSVGLNETFVRQLEYDLYEELSRIAADNNWLFVDILTAFRNNPDNQALYNSKDLHVNEFASQLIGRAQAQLLTRTLSSKRRSDERASLSSSSE